MMLPGGDPEFCAAFLAVFATSPLGLLTEEVKESVEKLFCGHFTVEYGDAVGVHGAEDCAGADERPAEGAVAFGVGDKQS